MTTETQAKPTRLAPPMKLEKVFIALRTDFFGDEDEHITLQYFHKADFNHVIGRAKTLREYVPTEIELNGFANWKGSGERAYYEVALVNAFENPFLFKNVRTPHITLRMSGGPISNATFDPRYYGSKQIADQLWLGKKSRGKFIWFPIENKPTMEIAEKGWEILGNL